MVLGALLAGTGTAQACALCGGGNPANRFAFIASTVALTLLPLGLFAGAFLWLRSRARGRLADEFRERNEAGAQPAGTAAEAPSPH